jgi:prepilin signal peptidase PulO-like enzyme (type II secretory pathway)
MTRPDNSGTASPGDTAPDVPAPPFPAKTLRQARRLTAAAIVVAAAWLAALALRTGPSPLLPALAYLAAIAVPLAVTDIRHRRLPDRLTLPSYPAAAGLLAIAAAWTPGGGHRLLGAVTGLAATLGLYLLAAWLAPGTGWGDVKLSGVLGLYLGWYGAPVLVAGLFAGVLFHALFGTALIAARRATLKTRIPFGPFMLAGAMTAILAFGPTASPAPGHPAAGPALSATLPSPCPSIKLPGNCASSARGRCIVLTWTSSPRLAHGPGSAGQDRPARPLCRRPARQPRYRGCRESSSMVCSTAGQGGTGYGPCHVRTGCRAEGRRTGSGTGANWRAFGTADRLTEN